MANDTSVWCYINIHNYPKVRSVSCSRIYLPMVQGPHPFRHGRFCLAFANRADGKSDQHLLFLTTSGKHTRLTFPPRGRLCSCLRRSASCRNHQCSQQHRTRTQTRCYAAAFRTDRFICLSSFLSLRHSDMILPLQMKHESMGNSSQLDDCISVSPQPNY